MNARTSRLRACAALLVTLTCLCGSSRETSAQLGSLIVSISHPTPGSTVGGTIPVTASVSIVGGLTVAGVRFTLDGAELGAEDTSPPYSIPWNTRTTSNGSHTLRAIARDVLGATWTSNPVTVTVFNDTTPPTVGITTPAGGAMLAGAITVNATASDNVAVVGIQFRRNGAPLGAEDTSAPWAVSWDTRTATNGSHALTAVARDAAGNTTTSTAVTVTVDNAAPTVALTAPAPGATVSSTITLSAGASDNVGVAGVRFRLDGVALGAEDTTAPYTVSWDTRTATNGSHALTAVARDAAGNSTTSTTVAVTVDNGAPTVTLTSPTAGAALSGTITVGAGASDNVGVVGVQFRLDGFALGAEDTAAPYSVAWDTRTATNGSHALTAVARDAAGNSATSTLVAVTVDNGAPAVTLTSPTAGAALSGTITVGAGASDNVGIVGVQFRLDGAALGAEDTTAPYSIAWDTRTAANGSHALTAVARDAAGNSTTSTAVSVTVDNAAPTVTLTAPAAGATVSGTVTVSANASDNVGVAGVRFRLDGADLGAEDTTAPYSVPWDTRTATNGAHTLTAIARDAVGNTTTSGAVSVTVDNTVPDTTAPTVTMTAPAGGATVSGTVTVSANASDNVGVAGVRFRLDGADLGAEDTAAPYSVAWDTRTATNGAHTLTAIARDAAGNTTTAGSVAVTVDNTVPDTTAPTVTMTAPAGGGTVSGTVTVSADASDNVGVAGVRFRLDGADLGAEDTAAPYSVAWDTRTATNGAHTLTAIARDAAGNTTTAGSVAVTVDNTVPDTTAPTVTMTAPAGGGTVSGTVTVSADASDNVGVAGVRFRLDSADLGAEDTTAPYAVSWDTGTAANGPHTLTAIARDAAGNTTTAATVTVTVSNSGTVTRVEETSSAIVYTGEWIQGNTHRPWSGGTAALGFAAGQFAQFTFSGTGVTWLGFRSPMAGIARVIVDGGPPTTIDAYAETETISAVMFTASGLTNGTHVIRIEATGDRNPAATDRFVVIDAFDVTSAGGGPGDTTAPTVSVTSPAGGATVSGTITVSANASDNVGVTGVQFRLDGGNLGAEDTTAPYSVPWDTVTTANGSHLLTAVARDAAGNSTVSASVAVTVTNGGGGNTIRFQDGNTAITYLGTWSQGNTSRPWSGGTAAVGGTLGQRATLDFRGTGVTWIGFRANWTGIANVYLDGTLVATVDAYAPTETVDVPMFTASGLAAGPHTLVIEVTHTKNASSTDYVVVVDAFDIIDPAPDSTAPAVSITSPSGGATVFGTVPVTASASDDTGVASVAFFVDGMQIGATDTVSPYSVNWNTAMVSDGSHTLTAIARDAAGNSMASAPVTVIVSNAAPPPMSTATRIENTSLAITYTDGCVSCGQPPEWFHGSRSRDWSGATASFNRADGARATFTFTGTTITWVGFRAAWTGIARVFVDGTFVTELDLYSATEQSREPVFQMGGLTPAVTHTITVESTGRKNVEATDYAVVVDAFDVSPPYPPPVEGTRFEETSSSATFTSGWTQGDTTQPWSGSTAAVSTTPGARATFVFTGTSVSWVGQRSPGMGIARVYLDGAFHAEVNLYAPTSIQEIVHTIVGLEAARHQLEIEVTGARHANATGHAIAVDAIDVRSRFEDNDVAITYSGAWGFNYTNRNWSGTSLSMGSGTSARSATAGARAEFAFTGTSVSWITLRAPWVGIADVYLDGVFASRVDLYAAAEQMQVPVFSVSGLTAGPHTLRIDVTGEKNAASTTALVVVDAFDVTIPTPAPPVTRVQETDSRISYTSGWAATGRTTLLTGENAQDAATVGAQATITFTGTSVRWVGYRGTATGVARVLLDGVFLTHVDTRTSMQEEYQRQLLSVTGLAPGSHTLTIEVVGRNNEAPGASVERIYIDAFDLK